MSAATSDELIPADFLAILRCVNDAHPRDDGVLRIAGSLLVCTVCSYGYRVDDGIPNMLWDEALTPDKVKAETT